MPEVINTSANIAVELTPSWEAGDPLLRIYATDKPQSQEVILFLAEASALYEALPGLLARLAEMETQGLPANHRPQELNPNKMLPLQILGSEMLSAMDDQVLVDVYRLLVRLRQQDAANFLAEYARRVADIDLAKTQDE